MKSKRFILGMIICCIFIIILTLFPNHCYGESDLSLQGIVDDANRFLGEGQAQDTLDKQKVKDIVIPISQILVGVGNAIIVVGMAIMGIKYIMSSPENKAKLKTQLVGLCISAAVIFGAEFIWRTIYNFLNSMS